MSSRPMPTGSICSSNGWARPNCPYSLTDSLGNNAAVTLAVSEAAGTVTLTWTSVTAFTASRVYMARYVCGGV